MAGFRQKGKPWTWPRKRSPIAAALARKAPKRHTWVESANVTCTPQFVECLGCNGDNSICCRANFGIVVFNQSVLQAQFNDEATVVAMRGYITIMPQIQFSGNPDNDAQYLDTFGCVGTMGLRKDDITTKQPLGAEYDLLDTGDYTESKQRRTWEHHQWPSRSSLVLKELGPSQVIGCCSNVTGSISGGAGFVANGITWTATAGAIDTSITGTITTECGTPCVTDPGFSPSLNGTSNSHRELSPWKWSVTSRKKFKCREDEELKLNLSLGYFDMFNGGNCPPPNSGFLWMARIKTLVEF